ncbi:type I methionyl aminopeptidase [Paenibacillus polymyxa]|uniref:type I methionyl aminopeptidase n=1 Tax=Paenibacillus polymyxa TaxID=1406 RepID=UPI002AB51456|nr:type I methionyl aminopeptidase [Paenibacillus polymyxa]MDY8023835.1 type I methionyl aminopeptidase [Paenibacillus polymyxa]
MNLYAQRRRIPIEIAIRTPEEIGYMREAGRILADCHRALESRILPGITTLEIDAWVEQFLNKRGATPEQKGYKGFPYATCASVNEVVCHGFPSERVLHDGDIVTIDIVVNKDGWLADRGWTYAVGNISRPVARLLRQTHKALVRGIEVARPGRTLGDIGHAVEKAAGWRRFGNVKPLIGHGIGRQMHEPPDVLHYGRPKTGLPLREGMVITIEPVFTLGTEGAVLWEDDGWTISTADGSWGAQYEHTIAITKNGPYILTS